MRLTEIVGELKIASYPAPAPLKTVLGAYQQLIGRYVEGINLERAKESKPALTEATIIMDMVATGEGPSFERFLQLWRENERETYQKRFGNNLALPINERAKRYAISELALTLKSVAMAKRAEEREMEAMEEELAEITRLEMMERLNAGAFG